MSERYRICQNCGASLAAGATYCPRCGAPYLEPIIQQPGEFEPFPPEQPGATEPQVAQPQRPIVQQGAPYPPQGQVYVTPSAQSPYPPSGYGQQTPVTPGQEQVGGPSQSPIVDTEKGLRINFIIGIIVIIVLLVFILGGFFFFLGQRSNITPGTTPTPGVTPTPGTTPTPTPTSVPFRVTTIDMSVNPVSIAGMPCGTQLPVTYTATFHVLPNGPGGVVQFSYTTDGGLNSKTGSKQFSPGQTSIQFQFASSGTLALNGAFPGAGQVTTTSPNGVSSQAITPSGSCTPTPTPTSTP